MVIAPQPVLVDQEAQDIEPLPNSERRLVGRALTGWETLRGDRRFPCLSDYGLLADGEVADENFLIKMGEDEENDIFIGAGAALIEALRINPLGRQVMNVLPSATEKGLSFCRAAAELKKPIADVGRFTNVRGQDVSYRSVLLPLSDDQQTINYLVGAFSFKFVD